MESKILNDFCFHKPKTLDEALSYAQEQLEQLMA